MANVLLNEVITIDRRRRRLIIITVITTLLILLMLPTLAQAAPWSVKGYTCVQGRYVNNIHAYIVGGKPAPSIEKNADFPNAQTQRFIQNYLRNLSSRGSGRSSWKTSKASWYGPGLYGGHTANGSRFTKDSWGLAHRSLPFGTRIEIEYKGKKVIVPVFDRGPFTRGLEWDLSGAVAKKLGFSGVNYVRWRVVE